MTDQGFMPLHYATVLIVRLIRLKFRDKAKVRAAIRSAILKGDLAVHWGEPEEFARRARKSWGHAIAPVPAWAFEDMVVAEEALGWSRLPINPWLAELPDCRGAFCVVQRGALRRWLSRTTRQDFEEPFAPEAHDVGHRLPLTDYREPPQLAFIALSAAISWADGRISLAGQDYADAHNHVPDRKAMEGRHAEILNELLEAARDSRLPMKGRPYADDQKEAGGTRVLTVADLATFQRYDYCEESLTSGTGIACSDFEEYSDDDAKRGDCLREVRVSRRALFKLYPPKRPKSIAAAEGRAQAWLDRAFNADRLCKRSKAQFCEEARQAIAGLSERAFNRAWRKIAPPVRVRAGRSRSRSV